MGLVSLVTGAVSPYLAYAKIALAAAVVAAIAIGGAYVASMHYRLERAAAENASLTRTVSDLRASQAALEADVKRAEAARARSTIIKKEVLRAPDSGVPEPIARALDGLRDLQRPKPRSAR